MTQIDRVDVIARLAAAGCVAAGAEAAALLNAAPDDAALESWIERRETGEPLAWIVGSITFCGHTVRVDPGVYVPRWQSEELARRAAAALLRQGGRAVDLCTGAGAIAVHLADEAPESFVMGTDLDPTSVRCARRNGVTALVADLGAPLLSAAFDVVTVVAPYVPTAGIDLLPADVQRFEPRMALDGGDDGLDIVRRAATTAARLLRPGGWFFAEIGGEQDHIVERLLDALGFEGIDAWYDDEGDLRGMAVRARHTTA